MRGRKPISTAVSTKMATQIIWRIAVYIRLSREDSGEESGSVTNQKKILTEYLKQYFSGKYVIVDFYIEARLPQWNEAL